MQSVCLSVLGGLATTSWTSDLGDSRHGVDPPNRPVSGSSCPDFARFVVRFADMSGSEGPFQIVVVRSTDRVILQGAQVGKVARVYETSRLIMRGVTTYSLILLRLFFVLLDMADSVEERRRLAFQS
jgi:hypothetical protein